MLQGSVPGTPKKTDNKVNFMNEDNNEYKCNLEFLDFDNIGKQNDLNFIMNQYNCCGGGVVHDKTLQFHLSG